MKPVLTDVPALRPVSLAEAKAHLRVDFSDDDTLISALIDAATAHIDGYTGILARALVTQTWRQDFCDWPGDRVLRLPLAPVASVESVKYFDAANVETTVSNPGTTRCSKMRAAPTSSSRPTLPPRRSMTSVTTASGSRSSPDMAILPMFLPRSAPPCC